MSSTKKIILFSTLAATLAGALVMSFAGTSSAREGSSAASQRAARTPGPASNFGFSATVQAKIDRLNAQLDACLIAHGAQRVSLGKGWTYSDPGGKASTACANVQSRINAYVDSAEYRQAVAAVLPAVRAYSDCLQRQGISQAAHGASTAAERAARRNAILACGGSAKDAVPGG
jgi:hypothetical protein